MARIVLRVPLSRFPLIRINNAGIHINVVIVAVKILRLLHTAFQRKMVAPCDCVTGLIINAAFNDEAPNIAAPGIMSSAPVMIATLSLVTEGLIQPVTDIGGFVYRFDGIK